MLRFRKHCYTKTMDNKLTEFIRTSLVQGVSKEVIKSNLLKANWTEQQVEEAFKTSQSEVQQKIPKTLLVFLGFLALLHYLSAIFLGLVVPIILDRTVNVAGFGLEAFSIKYGFWYLIFGVVTIISGSLYLYGAFKVRQGTKFSFYLTLFLVLVWPFIYTFLLYLIYNLAPSFLVDQETVQQLKFNPNQFKFFFSSNGVLYLLILGALIFYRKRFNNSSATLTLKSKLILLILSALLLIPSLAYYSYNFVNSRTPQEDYKEIQSKTSWHIYLPTSLPKDFVREGKINPKYDKELNKTVLRQFYNLPLDKAINVKSGILIIDEVLVDDNFDLASFISNKEKAAEYQQYNSKLAKNGDAYYRKYQLKDGSASFLLVFITNDNVLIQQASVSVEESNFLGVSNSLH